MSIDITIIEHVEAMKFGPKSKGIPIQRYIQRTASELQLCEDEAVADYRDYCMYSRIVGGITRKQMKLLDLRHRYQNDQTIENIMRTRHESGPYALSVDHDHVVNLLHHASSDMYDWEPNLVETDSSNETDSEQSDTLFELEL